MRLKMGFLSAALLFAAALSLAGCGGGSEEKLELAVVSSDLAVGPNRMTVTLFDSKGEPYGDAELRLQFFQRDDPTGVKFGTGALWLGETLSVQSPVYAARATFDLPGTWDVEATAKKNGKTLKSPKAQFLVQPKATAPNIGDAAPLSRQATLADSLIEQLTSARPTGDPDFYKLTIADAVALKKPFMVIFSTPAFCQSRTCGPQLENAQALKQQYGAQMNFIHIEIYVRPDLLLFSQIQPTVNGSVTQWKLLSEPWTFLIDADGKVFDRLEGYAPQEELEASVRDLLNI